MADLTTRYLGLDLAHPVVASASPLSRTLDGIRRLEDAEAAAIVLFSLFEEEFDTPSGGETDSLRDLSWFREGHALGRTRNACTPDEYLELIRRAKESVNVPIIASINGVTDGGWTAFAAAIELAGADAIELNIFHVPADLTESGRIVEQRYVDVTLAVRSATRIPLAVKIGPYFSSVAQMARRLVIAGADGLVLFNRFYQPDIDLERQDIAATLQLSDRQEMRLPLLWIGLLHRRLPADLAATTGVETAGDVVKYLLAGADVVMTASSLLRNGADHMGSLVRGLQNWLSANGYDSVAQVRGKLSQENAPHDATWQRTNYRRMLAGYRAYTR